MTIRVGPPRPRPPRPDWLVGDATKFRAACRAAHADAACLGGVLGWCGRYPPLDDGERELLLAREVAGDAALYMQKLG